MSLGLKGKIKPTVLELQERREKGENITLREFMQERFPAATVNHLYAENDIDPRRTTVEQLMKDEENAYLMVEIARDGVCRGAGLTQREILRQARAANLAAITTDPTNRAITPEQYLDPVTVGMAEAAFFNDLILDEVPVDSLQPVMPKIDLSDAKPKKTREGSKIELGTVTYGSKTVPVYTYALGIEFTYESIKFNRLNLVSRYFEDLGMRMAALKNDELSAVALNGDQADLSESSAVIGVDTVNSFLWKDVVRVFNRMKRMGRNINAVLASEDSANDWENMAEVKNRVLGTPRLANRRTSIPSDLDVYIGGSIPSTQLQFISTMLAFLQLTAQGVLFETDKIISKRMEEAYVSESCGFMVFQRDARITVDKSIAYSGNQFPSWFNVK
ncbi:MAG: hypothetical protein K1X72_04295 [Pyrinomonadaceae bacterium]|nr:hypothetical protein [Pyrinomonadaceae bacterium]